MNFHNHSHQTISSSSDHHNCRFHDPPLNHDHGHSHHLSSNDAVANKRHGNNDDGYCDDNAAVEVCCSGADCCGDNHAGDHDHAHHGHHNITTGHDHVHANSVGCCDDDEDCCGDGDCCASGTSPIHDHAHGHQNISMGHDHVHSTSGNCCDNDDDCCTDGNCCGEQQPFIIDHNHSHAIAPHSPLSEQYLTPPIATVSHDHDHSHSDVASILVARQCDACDANSSLPHAHVVTRLRIANLCCAGEERIIRSSLEGMHGIESVAVNIVGRYAIVKHCPIECCAPTEQIVEILNAKRLGASIQEANDGMSTEPEEAIVDMLQLFHLSILVALLIAGLVTANIHFLDPLIGMIIFIIGTGVGVLPILRDAMVAILRRNLDIHILMLIAIIGAMASGEYFDGCLLVTLFIGAEFIENTIMRKVRKIVKLSVGHTVETATLVSGKSIPVKELKVGDRISIRTGEMICVDGLIVKGECVVNESAVTGESMPIPKQKGEKVLSGTIAQNGYIEVEVTVEVKDGTMQRLQQTVNDMQTDRGQYAKLIDEFSKYWTPIVLLIAFILVVAGGASSNDWDGYVHKGLVLLVLTCPCAIVISAPIPSVCTIAISARHGVLIKGSTIIERLGSINSIAIDKTGTLTKGFFKVSDKTSFTTSKEDGYFDPLELAASVEVKSTHPLADAIVSEFCGCIAEMEGDLKSVKKMKVIDGVGISAWVEVDGDWKFVTVGNERLLDIHGGQIITSLKDRDQFDSFSKRNAGSCIIIVVVEDCLELAIALSDEVREESKEFISRAYENNLSVTMLTGDHEAVAVKVAEHVNISVDNCKSRLLPQDKLAWIENAQGVRGKFVMMIGDGINDATALSIAHVGVAMGEGGSAMAVDAADLVIMSDNLLRINSTIQLCRSSKAVIVQNCIFAVAIKIIAVILAGLGYLEFWHAVLIDLGSLVVVILNGLRPLFSTAYQSSSLDKIALINPNSAKLSYATPNPTVEVPFQSVL